jgi:hypothetical protein
MSLFSIDRLPFQWLLDRLKGRHAVYAYIVGTVLLAAGLANSIHASLILATMTMGIVVTNIGSDNSQYVSCYDCCHDFCGRDRRASAGQAGHHKSR